MKWFFFFFQAEDGIRDGRVTGVQTCALPISPSGVVMFTGLVESVGDVVSLAHGADGAAVIEVASPLAGELSPGDSVAVSGACLTARAIDGDRFRADIVSETLRRTTLGDLEVGSKVNLELPLRASDRLGGHIVLGHVDGVGEVRAEHASGEIEVEIANDLSR